MIYTITFNPALDVSGVVDELVPNEKSYVHDERCTPGGNGINAGVIAHRLGADVTLTGFLGGANGDVISSLLEKEKINHKFIQIQSSTRMNLTVSNKKDHKQTRLSFPGAKVRTVEWGQLIKLLEEVKGGRDLVVIGGSLPPGISAQKVSSLIRIFKKRKVYCMVDIPSQSLEKLLSAKPSFIKPNLKEFQELTKSKVNTIKGVLKEMRKLNKHVPLICVSSVEGGAILANENEAWFGKTPKLSIHSTVGAGDSMVGAMATMLEKDPNAPLDEILRVGLAASSATLSESGMTLGSYKSMRDFMPKIKVKNIDASDI